MTEKIRVTLAVQRDFSKDALLRRAPTNSADIDEVPDIVYDVLRSPGQALDAGTRAEMEPRFGQDFSSVRIHTDRHAAESAAEVHARAYTVGHNVVFGSGEHSPETSRGRRLLAHELTHVVQQHDSELGRPAELQVGGERDGFEQEAESASSEIMDASMPAEPRHSPIQLNRQPTEQKVSISQCMGQEQTILDGIKATQTLVERAIVALKRDMMIFDERQAFTKHFGSVTEAQKSTIVARYRHIASTLGSKKIRCAKKDEPTKDKQKTCAKASCPGGDITLFPFFFTKKGCEAGATLLHEASHNAGACKDIQPGSKNYPPKASENNSYSYEEFAVALSKPSSVGVLPPKREVEIPVPNE